MAPVRRSGRRHTKVNKYTNDVFETAGLEGQSVISEDQSLSDFDAEKQSDDEYTGDVRKSRRAGNRKHGEESVQSKRYIILLCYVCTVM